MRGYFDNDFFGGHFDPRFGRMGGPPNGPFRGDFPGHHGRRSGFGPFGGFDHSPERHGEHQRGPEHNKRGDEDGHRGRRCGENDYDGPPGFTGPSGRPHGIHDDGPSCRGHFPCFGRGPERHGHHEYGNEPQKPTEDNHRGRRCGHHSGSDSDSDGPEGHHCHGPPGFRGRGGRHHGFHGHGLSSHGPRPCFRRNPCFGRRGPFDFPDRPFREPWEGPWGSDHPMNRFGRHGPSHPWFGHRRSCSYNSENRPSRKSNCEKCRETEPCCSGDKENRVRGIGRKETRPCCDKDKDLNLGDTVFVQRIVLEKATRPQSV